VEGREINWAVRRDVAGRGWGWVGLGSVAWAGRALKVRKVGVSILHCTVYKPAAECREEQKHPLRREQGSDLQYEHA